MHSPLAWPAAVPCVCKWTEDTGQILLPLGWTHANTNSHSWKRCAALKWDACETCPLYSRRSLASKEQEEGGRRGTLCSKVVPLLPELLLTFMNRAFTPSSPHGLPPLCTVQIRQLTCGGPGRERGTMVSPCSCRKNSSQLFGISIPLSRSFSKSLNTAATAGRLGLFLCLSRVGTAAAICVMM